MHIFFSFTAFCNTKYKQRTKLLINNFSKVIVDFFYSFVAYNINNFLVYVLNIVDDFSSFFNPSVRPSVGIEARRTSVSFFLSTDVQSLLTYCHLIIMHIKLLLSSVLFLSSLTFPPFLLYCC